MPNVMAGICPEGPLSPSVGRKAYCLRHSVSLLEAGCLYICAPNEKPALRISCTVAAELYCSVIRDSALGNNYVIAIIRGSSSP